MGLRPVASLLPHEETIPSKSEKLFQDMKKEGIQRDPLIIDYESGTVLDGMHRLSAFKKLGAEHAVCYLVDYSSKGVTLQRWVRVYEVKKPDLVPTILEELGLNQKATLGELFDLVEGRKTALGLIGAGSCFVAAEKGQQLTASFDLIRRLDKVFSALGWPVSFAAEDEIDVATQDPSHLVAITPKLNKQDVLTASRSGRLFPWKTSMHVVDPRPVAIDFPLADLMGMAPPTAELDSILKEGAPRLLPPNTTYKGRRYKERLLLLRGR